MPGDYCPSKGPIHHREACRLCAPLHHHRTWRVPTVAIRGTSLEPHCRRLYYRARVPFARRRRCPPGVAGIAEILQKLDRSSSYPYSVAEYFKRALWEWVQRTAIRFSPRRAYAWRRFWLRRFGAVISSSCGTRPTTRIVHPWLLKMGSYSIIADNVTIYNLGQVSIGDHTMVSQDVYVCAGTHDYRQADLPLVRSKVSIGDGVWVCAGAFIGPGVEVGDNSVVAARACVTRDVEVGVVVGGNPARVIKARVGTGQIPTGVADGSGGEGGEPE